MKKFLSLVLVLATVLALCACGSSEPAEPNYIANADDVAQLESLYGGRTAFHGELHDHSDSGGSSDGKQPLSIWKATMPGVGMDYAAILDHRQVLHMYLDVWDDSYFIGGSEAATTITDRPEKVNRYHYNMVFAEPEQLEAVVTAFTEFKYREWTEQDREGCGGQMHFNYPHMSAARFNELINAVKEQGGLFVIPHPSSTNAEVPPSGMDLYFQDYIGYEVFYGFGNPDSNNWKTEANYKLWTDMLAGGARVWASAGNDGHQYPEAKCLSTVYSEEGIAQSHITHLRVGDFTAGPIGIKMSIGDTHMGSTGSFENNRVVFSVGDFHQDIALQKYTFEVSLLTEKGVVFTYEMTGDQAMTFAVDADANARFYRVEVYNKTLKKLTALGNPIWNEAKYK